MNKLKKLEAKKLLKELEFFESDFEYKNEVISEADSEFLNSVNSFLSNHPQLKELYDKKINDKIDQMIKKKEDEIKDIQARESESEGNGNMDGENVEEEENGIQEDQQDVENKEDVKSPKLKKLYRDIVKLTHPDKVKSEKLNALYIKATSFYDKNDLAGIYSICDEIGIEYEVDEEDNVLISDKINTLRQRISFMEQTFTWKWFYGKDQQERDNIILTYIRMQLS